MDWVVGRKQEIDALIEKVSSNGVVTIVGGAGVGKSTIAKQVAAEYSGSNIFSRDVVMTNLDSIQSVAPDSLIVLDDVEGIPCQQVVTELSQTHPVLVTSRVPIGVPHEQIFRVEGLPPDDAVELFRRVAGRHGVSDDGQFAAFASVDSALTTIPLVIELLVPRLGVTPVEEIPERLVHPHFLEGPNLSRFPSYRESVLYSLDLLSPPAHDVFIHLCVLGASLDFSATVKFIEASCDADPIRVLQELSDLNVVIRDGRILSVSLATSRFVVDNLNDVKAKSQAVAFVVQRCIEPLLPKMRLGDTDACKKLYGYADAVRRLVSIDIEVPEAVLESALLTMDGTGFDRQTLDLISSKVTSDSARLTLGRAWTYYEYFDDAEHAYKAITGPLLQDAEIELYYLGAKARRDHTRPKITPGSEPTTLLIADAIISMAHATDGVLEDDSILHAARDQASRDGDRRAALRVEVMFGIQLSRCGDFDAAQKCYRTAQTIAEPLSIHLAELVCCINIATIDVRRGRYKRALAQEPEILAIVQKTPHHSFAQTLAVLHYNFAMSLLEIGAIDLAEARIRVGLDTLRLSVRGEEYESQFRFLLSAIRFCKTGTWPDTSPSDLEKSHENVGILFNEKNEVPLLDASREPNISFINLYLSKQAPLDKIASLQKFIDLPFSQILRIASLSNLDAIYQWMGTVEHVILENKIRTGCSVLLSDLTAIRTTTNAWKLVDSTSTLPRLISALGDVVQTNEELVERLWPDDRSSQTALNGRLKVAVSSARKLGFDIGRRDGTYVINTPLIISSREDWNWANSTDAQVE